MDAYRNPQVLALLRDGASRAVSYLEGLDARAVAPSGAAVAALDRFREALPAAPSDPAETLALLDELGSPASVAMAGGRFFGFVIGGSLPVSVASSWLATAWDQNTGLAEVTPATARLEEVALDWMVELLGLPAGTGGGFVTGATLANFTALAAARHAVLTRAGWDVEGEGLFGAPPITVIVGAEAHPSVLKALGMLGLGRRRVLAVPADGQGRMRVDALPKIDGPTIVCVQAGNVNTGASDPVADVCAVARPAGAWVHVDGAFGLWAAAAPSLENQVRGIGDADSWATDAHKWLNVPYDSGIAFARDPHAMRAALAVSAAYLPTDTPNRNPSDFTPEFSRRARGVDVWAVLRTLGRAGIADLMERCCRHARRFAEGLCAAGFEVLNEVVLNQVLVAFGDEAQTRRVIAAIQREGTCWAGVTVWQGRTAMRISVSSWATTDEDVEKSLAAMIRCGRAAGA